MISDAARVRASIRASISAIALAGAVALSAAPALAAGDVQKGAALFENRCEACHSTNPTRKPGPDLAGVYGRHAGTFPGYHYSDALKASTVTWNAQTLDHWLTNPPAYIPGVNMMAMVAAPQDRQDLIAYLKSISPKAH